MTVSARRGVTVAELVHEQAAVTPEAIAVVDAGLRLPPEASQACPRPPHGIRSLSYREVSGRAKLLAHQLRQGGVEPGSVVAVCARRSADLVVGLLGVLTCGAVYLPLDPDHSSDHLAGVVGDAKPRLILSQPEAASRLRRIAPGATVETLGYEPSFMRDPVVPWPSARLSDLAYLGYQADGSGQLVGVEIEHRSVLGLVTAMATEFGGGQDSAWLTITGPACPATLPTLLLPLVLGARIVVADQASVAGGRSLLDVIQRYQVTHLPASAGVWRSLLAAGLPESDLVALVLGHGINRELARAVRQLVRRMSTMSGSLESTIWSVTCPLPTDPDCVPLGRPMVNSRIYLLDQWFCPVPDGTPGELYIGGPCVARGYHRRPELTAKRFVLDPYLPEHGRLFRTGQLARWRDSHRLEYVGPAR